MAPHPEEYLRSARRLIGRQQEQVLMLEALAAPTDQLRVLLFEGPGGIGKTRLLHEARALCDERPVCLCTDVLDLYLSHHQGQARLLSSIARQLQQAHASHPSNHNPFAAFLAALEHFYAHMGEGSAADQRQKLEKIFLAEYQTLANRYRIVLLIDTLEKIHPAIPEAAEFDFREMGRLEGWLAQLLCRLPNTTVFMAGRPRELQRQLFASALGAALHVVSLAPFTLEETTSYITSEFADLSEFDEEKIEVLHRISAGRPVLLAIALACTQHELIDLLALPAGFDAENSAYRETLSEHFVDFIVGDLFTRRPAMAQMLARAVYLRKGLRSGLLERIVASEDHQMVPSEVAAELEHFAQFVFVKRIGEHGIMLHDEMYELLLDRIGAQQTAIWWRSAIGYLNEEIARTNDLLQARMAMLQSELASSDGPLLGYAQLQQQLQSLKIERLFYQLALNPQQGYQSYRELLSHAIAARDYDFDAQLQDELARFFEPQTKWGERYRAHLKLSNLTWERIVYEDGIRWVARRINAHLPGADSYMDAIRIAERVRERYRAIYDNYQLARCDLEAAQLQAEIYIAERAPRGIQITQNYTALCAALSQLLATAPADDSDAAYARLILANAYNYWGYFERTRDRLESAIAKYSEAILLYRQLGPEVESLQAVTLTNLGYALSRQGDSQRGLLSLERTLNLVTRTGIVYRVGMTYNVQAHIFADLGQNERALRCALEAQRLLAPFDSIRAQGLNHNALGRIRSRIAAACSDPVQRDGEYALAAQAYREAIRAFDAEGELTRRIEVRASLARSLRDWARDRDSRGSGAAQRNESLAIIQEARALTTAKTPPVLRCNLLEANASILNDQGDYAQALTLLDAAYSLLPANLQMAQGFNESDTTRELRIYWLRFAQIELQYTLAAFGQERYEAGCSHLLRAFTGLLIFSPETAPIAQFREIARHSLLKLTTAATVHALRRAAAEAAGIMDAPAGAVTLVDRLLDQVAQTISDRDLFGL
ncbi:MAG: NACHT domain-containing protein [Candidatus Viridilinea halotolerans]|uniref:NACHT domain-containing protein n=1 Tax=Candidatus Viridilinea halotolerans TaxID=2491704 RepID=A0A426TUP2_9CHLR|nr:MAG: NACHT domain-containing protein [Candidatus Viridilinea halotolerans]